MSEVCSICGEIHDRDRPLSFDGFGINLCGMSRSRFATIPRHHLVHPWTDQLGAMMAAAPRMHAVLVDLATNYELQPKAMAAILPLLDELGREPL